MKTYLSNILPRIQQYNESLDKKELLVDQPWVLVDVDGNKEQYIFERDGKLIMSHNGQVQYGTWRYIPSNKSLLIDRKNDSVLLNHQFFNEAICVLKKDGFKDEPWILINEQQVPNLDLESYLESLINRLEKPPAASVYFLSNGETSNNRSVGLMIFIVVMILLVVAMALFNH